ncbi:asparaginase [Micromonospora parathelypteridis]|uniref:L-asparaginase n=1 Tax=Micromonospora parathelypteridis TaxID=1839617 RepID=A0A840VT12_9ACTN|nr:asparaginase [Micromonospora parathelypteridis]MBB5479787.1 L-asparaginase [Micromonospora parathelypteridis]GGO31536.1 L-asparaginase [Micromonospora parathelypteridis]
MTIALITLGGTIAMGGVDAGRPGVVARLTGADLTAAVPGLAELGVPVDVRDPHAVPSANLTGRLLLDVVGQASQAVADGATGVVITQGTDTLEETAFLADLLWPHAAPLVFTGAMRNPTLAGADGPANLLAALRVAAAPHARDLGVLVAVNDELHAARWLRKTHSTSTATFASPNTGPLGQVIEGEVRVLTRPPRHEPLPPVDPDRLDATRVALYVVTMDDDGLLLNGLADTHHAVVVAGFGVGHVPSALAPVLGDLAERIPVVLTSRSGAGSVLRHTYGAVGSETDLQRRGLLNGGLLDPYKARVLLRLLLAGDAGRDEVTAALARHG